MVPHGLELLAISNSSSGKPTPVADADEQFEGLIASDLEFDGPLSEAVAASRLVQLSAPRSSNNADLPGVDPARLPIFHRE